MISNSEFFPLNRYILLEDIEEDKKELDDKSEVLIPEECKNKKNKQNRYKLYLVKAASKDCNICLREKTNYTILVDDSQTEEIEIWGKKYKLILDNFVIGIYL